MQATGEAGWEIGRFMHKLQERQVGRLAGSCLGYRRGRFMQATGEAGWQIGRFMHRLQERQVGRLTGSCIGYRRGKLADWQVHA